MTQKELNYVEDFYNHITLFKDVLLSSLEILDDESSCELLNNHLNECDVMLNNIKKLVEGEC